MTLIKIKKVAAVFAALCLTIMPVAAQDAEEVAEITESGNMAKVQLPVTGEGKQQSPYVITDRAGLEYMATLAQSGETKSVYFELGGNVELNSPLLFTFTEGEISSVDESSAKWTPVGSTAKPFQGNFDGKGYYITGLYCDNTNVTGGLFGVIDGATVKNVNLDFALVESKEYAGIVAAKAVGESSISGCVVYGSVIGKQQQLACTSGGIVGSVDEDTTITDCCFYGAVSGADAFYSNVGGIAGFNKGKIEKCTFSGKTFGVSMYFSTNVGGIAGTNSGEITGCQSYGSVGAESTEVVNESNAGGIAGKSEGFISQCKNLSEVYGYSASLEDNIGTAGGIAGYVENSNLYGCENSGKVLGEHGVYAGGIAGLSVVNDGEYKIYDCINNGEIDSEYGMSGGIVARVSASGYVTYKNELVSCANTASVNGTSCGGVVGAVYEENAAVVIADCYYPVGLPDSAQSGTYTVAEAGFTSGNALYGLDNEAVWVFKSGKMPYILFEDGLSKKPSAIIAEPSQIVATGTQPLAQGTGTMLLSKEIASGVCDVVVRFTGDDDTFAPKPVVINVTAVSEDDALTILSIDTSGAVITESKLSGTVRVKLYAKEADKKYIALTSVFVDGAFANIRFNEITSVEDLSDATLVLPAVILQENSEAVVKIIIVENTQNFKPVCEAAELAVGA